MIWTHYGRWSNDGLVVYNNDGRIIYRLADSVHQRLLAVSTFAVLSGSPHHPAQSSLTVRLREEG